MKHFSRSLFVLVAGSILLSSAALAAPPPLRFHLTDLGAMGGYQTTANAINNGGQVVGNIWFSNGDQKCFLFKGKQVVVFGSSLRDLTLTNYCDATAINQLGEIAGSIKTNVSGNPTYAYRRDTAGVIHTLAPLYGGTSYATGINDSGNVVGNSSNIATLWNPAGQGTDLGNLGGGWADAHAIDSNGAVVGRSFGVNSSANGASGYWGFLWANGSMTGLPTLNGSQGFDRALAINSSGSITGTP